MVTPPFCSKLQIGRQLALKGAAEAASRVDRRPHVSIKAWSSSPVRSRSAAQRVRTGLVHQPIPSPIYQPQATPPNFSLKLAAPGFGPGLKPLVQP